MRGLKILAVFSLAHWFSCATASIKSQSTNSVKRQYINPVKINSWTGPYFTDNQQKEAFEELTTGDVSGSKRMELQGIDPDKILNPVPEKPPPKIIKDEGPVAETYLGKDPDADKVLTVSPQERLAHFISKPIIHTIEHHIEEHDRLPARQHHNSHIKEDSERILETRRYMFSNNDDDGRDHEFAERRRFGDDDNLRDINSHHYEDDVRFRDHDDRDRLEKSFRADEREREPNFPDHERDRFDDRDEDREKKNFKRSTPKLSKWKRKQKKKKNSNSKKKSELALGGHIPESMMPGGIPDPSENVDSEQSAVPTLELQSPGEAEGAVNENEARHSSEVSFNDISSEQTPEAFSSEHAPEAISGEQTPEAISSDHMPESAPDTPFQETPGVPMDFPSNNPGALNLHNNNNGDSDVPVAPENALSLSGVGLNSHSGVKEFAESAYLAQANTQVDENLPVNKQPGPSVEEKVVKGEATFQSGDETTENPSVSLEGQNKERFDQGTIFVHHQRRDRTQKRKAVNKIMKTNSSLVETNLHKRSQLAKLRRRDKINFPRKENNIKSSGNDKIKNQKRWGYSTEHQNGFLEDNVANEMNHEPYLMTVGTHEGTDIHKEWNNMHSPGNGYYVGAGVGPSRTMEGDYIHHNSHDAAPFHGGGGGIGHGVFGGGYGGGFGGHVGGYSGFGFGGGHEVYSGYEGHDIFGGHSMDPLHSLEGSESRSDHETAGLIGAIWDHDEDGDHIGRGRHHGKEAISSFFGQGTLLPSETLDGIGGGGHGGFHGGHWGHSSIQDLQDDTSIDSQLSTMGIGTEMSHHGGMHGHHGIGHGHHGGNGMSYFEGHDVGSYGHSLGGHGVGGVHEGVVGHGYLPVDVPHHAEMSPEEYHHHIDNLMNRYHQLEVDLKGQHGSLMDHLDENLLHHHGHPHYHTGYDIYTYANPWHNAQLPYHVPVENHPDNSGIEEQLGGGSMEQGGKDDGKGEEKGGPLVEAKEESKPPPKKDDDKIDDKDEGGKGDKKPIEIHKKPDWTGMPPKIPKQRGGPEQSGSVGLNEDNSLTGNLPTISEPSKLSPLRQAISAYKAMNLSVPPSLQIEELKEELKEAKAEAAQNKLPVVASVETPASSSQGSAEDSKAKHKTGETKDKAPVKLEPAPSDVKATDASAKADTTKVPEKAALPNGAAEVTQAIQTLGGKAALTNPQNAVAYQRLQQLNFAQQALLKQMLENAVTATKQENLKPNKEVDDEQATVEKILNLGHETDRNVQQAQLLAQLNNMLRQGATNTAFNNLVNSARLSSNFIQNPTTNNVGEVASSKAVAGDTKSTESDNKADALNTIVGNILSEAKLSTNEKEKDLKDEKVNPDAKALTPSDAPSLDISDEEKESSGLTDTKENSDLISLLNSQDVATHKKKSQHHKKKHHTSDDAYAKIGYEAHSGGGGAGDESGTKKDKANYVLVKHVGDGVETRDDNDEENTKKGNINSKKLPKPKG